MIRVYCDLLVLMTKRWKTPLISSNYQCDNCFVLIAYIANEIDSFFKENQENHASVHNCPITSVVDNELITLDFIICERRL